MLPSDWIAAQTEDRPLVEQPPVPVPLRGAVSRGSAFVSMLVSILIAGGYMMLCILVVISAFIQAPAWGAFAFMVTLLAITFNGFFMVGSIMAWITAPAGMDSLLVAISQPEYPLAVRPLVALWWLLHWAFAMALALALMLDKPGISVLEMIFSTVIAFGLAFASYSYLLMTVTVFTKSHQTLKRAWLLRSTWAACHSGLSLLVALVVEWVR